MEEYTKDNITDVVIDQMASTPDPRMKEVMESLVRHLHDFARDVNLTPAEWIKGIEFLTHVGHKCTANRQEFILLSDTLGMSALVNLLHDDTRVEEATQTSLLGPFFRENVPAMEAGAQINKHPQGPEIVCWGVVTDGHGNPVPNARIDIWQTSEDGRYDIELGDEIDMRGVFSTDADGRYVFKNTIPKGYYIPMDGPVGDMVRAQKRHGMRPAHIHYLISAPGYRELVTALYMAGDEHLEDDVVFGASGHLIAHIKDHEPTSPMPDLPSLRFDFTLSRESEADKLSGRVGADPAAIAGAPAE